MYLIDFALESLRCIHGKLFVDGVVDDPRADCRGGEKQPVAKQLDERLGIVVHQEPLTRV